MAVVRVLFISAFLCLTPTPLLGEQCKPDPLSPCKAQCNGTEFDLSLVFDFPMNISNYTWSPCTGLNCAAPITPPNRPTDCAVCEPYASPCWGKVANPVWIWEVKKPPTSKFPNWYIEYTFGDSYRMSTFYFIIDETQEDPIVKFEEPGFLQFIFHVIGKCIGQDTFECRKVYEKRRYMRNHPV